MIKAVIKGKFITIIKRRKISINNLNLCEVLEKQTKSKAGRRKEILNIQAEVNKNRDQKERKISSPRRSTKLTSLQRRWTKKKKRTQTTKIWNESWDITTDCRNKKDYKSIVNNCTPIYWITYMK